MIEKIFLTLFISISWNVYGQDFDESKPIWNQYPNLYCTTYIDMTCDLSKCQPTNVNRNFILNFTKNELQYLGKFNIKNELLAYSFKPKDPSIRVKVTNTIATKGSSIQIFNFQKTNLTGKPEFTVVESQIGLLPLSKTDIKTHTYYSECYPE
jgi:hypothetical protein